MIPYPIISDRKPGLVVLSFFNDESIRGYRLFAASSVNDAYGGFNGVPGVFPATPFIERLMRGEARISKAIQKRSLGSYGGLNGQTKFFYNPDEFAGVGTHPPDRNVAFLRTQVMTTASPTFPVPDPTNMSDIRILVTPTFNSFASPQITMGGNVPDIATAQFGFPPPSGVMTIRMPISASGLNLVNHGPGDLLYTLDPGLPLIQLDEGQTLSITTGLKDVLMLCAVGSNPKFSANLSVSAYGGH